MSRHELRTGRTALLAAGLLVGTTVALAPAASAEPARAERTCAQALEAAAEWPGTFELDGDEYHAVSDAYVTYLSQRPPCATAVAG